MGTLLKFQSCAYYNGKNEEFVQFGVRTPSSCYYIGVNTTSNTASWIPSCYAADTNLSGKVEGIGYGWQKYTVQSSGKVKFVVRGAAGGSTGSAGFSIDSVTGAISGRGNKPGRGAKLCGTFNVKKNDILYILVGHRGFANNGSDWGGGGGGASVILRDNPSGAYTFGPLNRKVDILVVAGGGGGCLDQNFGTQYWGQDAVFTDGANTNGGERIGAIGGGAGMTGNGAATDRCNTVPSILSGGVPYTPLGSIHYGGWGGGGSPLNGGGAGGGYSGGTPIDDNHGGTGGTSYINPTYCSETFRGYATVADDSGRNCQNPWSAYGFIELELGRDPTKFILAHDSDGYKYFNGSQDISGTSFVGTSNTWELLPTQTAPVDTTYAMYGSRVITNVTGLKSPVRFLVSSVNPTEVLTINGQLAGTTVIMKEDANMADVSTLQNMTVNGTFSKYNVKFAVSRDKGSSWQTYNSGSWVNIDVRTKSTFAAQGYDLSFFSAIPLADIQAYIPKSLRFAFYISQVSDSGANSVLTDITYVADLTGSWRHYTESQASYEYITDDTLEITFKEAGNYKVNYLDSFTSGSSGSGT